jgi:predicted membrane chloride channel (bestrophin family)
MYAWTDTLTGLEDISQEIENPFREAWHALPIDGICQAIQSNLHEIQARQIERRKQALRPPPVP